MKPEQLMDSLSGVGEDLLAASEHPIHVERRRPWIGAAVAAVLVLAAGIGGVAVWKALQRSPRTSTPTFSAELPTIRSAEPTNPMDLDYYVEALLPYGAEWSELRGIQDSARFCTEEELDAALSFSSDSLDAVRAGKLPVYYDLSVPDPSQPVHVYYSQAELTQMLKEAAEVFGLTVRSDVPEFDYYADLFETSEQTPERGPNDAVYAARVTTDQGVLTIRGDGQLYLAFDTEHVFTRKDEQQLFSSADPTPLTDFLATLPFVQEGAWFAALDVQPMAPWASNFGYYIVAPLRKRVVQRFLTNQFEQMRLTTVDGSAIYGYSMLRLPTEATFDPKSDCAVPDCWRLIGNYPVISLDEAKHLVLGGDYLLPYTVKDLALSESVLNRVEVVYLTDQYRGLLEPFYRFWIPMSSGEKLSEYYAVYVPAVKAEYRDPDAAVPQELTGRARQIARAVSAELSLLGMEEEFYDLLGSDLDRLYAAWQGGDAESYPRFGFRQIACSADGEWYFCPNITVFSPEDMARQLTQMLMDSLQEQSERKDLGYVLEDYRIGISGLCSKAELPGLPDNVWILDPEIAVKFTGQYGFWTDEDCKNGGLMDADGFCPEEQQGSTYVFLYVLTNRDGVWRLQRLEELVNTYLPVEHYSGHPVRDENDETLQALNAFFADAAHRAPLLDGLEGLTMEIDSYVRISDEELQLRYWRGIDKLIPYTANLRVLPGGAFEVLTDTVTPAVWSSSPSKPVSLKEISLDSLDPTRELGAGVNILYSDEDLVIFYGYFGILGYEWGGVSPKFTVDFRKAVGMNAQLQGDASPAVRVTVSEDGTQILILRVEQQSADEYTIGDSCLIDVTNRTWYRPDDLPQEVMNDSVVKGGEVLWGCDEGWILRDLWLQRGGEKWYPCR